MLEDKIDLGSTCTSLASKWMYMYYIVLNTNGRVGEQGDEQVDKQINFFEQDGNDINLFTAS